MYNSVCADISEIKGFFLIYVGENQGLMEKPQKLINM